MARLFCFSDIHANLPAMVEVYKHAYTAKKLDESNGDRVLIPGDLINYGGAPGSVIDFVQTVFKNPEIVIGNHEHYAQQFIREKLVVDLGEKTEDRITNSDVLAGTECTVNLLTEVQTRFIAELSDVHCMIEDRYRMSHSVPDSLETYVFPNSDVSELLKSQPTTNFIIGHSHIATVFIQQKSGHIWAYNPDAEWDKQFGTGWRNSTEITKISVGFEDAVNFLLVCPSVGKPRADDCLKAGYVIIDTDSKEISLYRIPYDHEKAARAIEENGMPQLFADHIRSGK